MLKRIINFLNINRKKEKISTEDKINNLYNRLYNDIILLNVGEDLSKLNDVFYDVIQNIREEIKEECGFIIPKIPVVYNEVLQENEFVFFIRGAFAKNGYLIPNEDGIKKEFYDELKTLIYDKMKIIFTNEITERYINTVQNKNNWLVWNITSILSIPDIKIILSDIINNGKSINDIEYIFEKIGDNILLEGKYQDCLKKYNPHNIAKEIIKDL